MSRSKARSTGVNTVDDEIARLRGLGVKGLRARWRGLFKREAPDDLPRHLLFGMIAYRLQTDIFGDLDAATRKAIDGNVEAEAKVGVQERLTVLARQKQTAPVGATLMREWKGRQHRVMATADGFAWNGKAFKSLSQVAFAITGTKWNGPRFFGLRDPIVASTAEEAR